MRTFERLYTTQDHHPQALTLQEALFHNANGYLGVRGTLEEGLPEGADTMRGTYLNGVYDITPMKQAEKLHNLVEDKEAILNIGDTQTVCIAVEGECFGLWHGEVLAFERQLDMDAGTTRRTVHWRSPKGHELALDFTRMASFVELPLFTIDISITPLNFSGEVTISSLHRALVTNYANPKDPRMAGEGGCYLQRQGHALVGERSFLCTATLQSGISICSAVAHTLDVPYRFEARYSEPSHGVVFDYRFETAEGESTRFVKYSAFMDSLRTDDAETQTRQVLEKRVGTIDALYREQREYLARFWQNAALEIHGDEETNLAMCFNQFQLLQACGKDGLCSVAAKGLSGEGYEGHYFWDTEMYVLPFFILTNPELAKKLLHFRHAVLPAARDNARLVGHRVGALYPWRTIHGRECSGYFPSGTAQYHINGAIAHAVVLYYLATGDVQYLCEQGAEILLETARLWLDTGNWHRGRFLINDVTGPDEYTCIVNNNFYTNACARYNLRWAVKAAGILEEKGELGAFAQKLGLAPGELEAFTRAADAMYLPYDEAMGINPQDDSFLQKAVWDLAATPRENFPLLLHYHPLHLYRYQVCKQADTLLAYWLFDGIAPAEVQRRSYEYYETVTTHDSSLSASVFSIVASSLQMYDKAIGYFGDSAKTDLMDTHGNTKDGIHTANMGGCYLATVQGFAGLRIREDGLYLTPFLPPGWEGFSFRFCFRGSLLHFAINGQGPHISLLEGAPVPVCLNGEWCTLGKEDTISRNISQ